MRDWRLANPARHEASSHRSRLKTKYGITVEEYDEKFAAQGGLCAICGLASAVRLCVDHRHSDGVVRGLLCKDCNVGIGLLKDSPANLESAIRYLSDAP